MPEIGERITMRDRRPEGDDPLLQFRRLAVDLAQIALTVGPRLLIEL
jgi:hypothetical protein